MNALGWPANIVVWAGHSFWTFYGKPAARSGINWDGEGVKEKKRNPAAAERVNCLLLSHSSCCCYAELGHPLLIAEQRLGSIVRQRGGSRKYRKQTPAACLPKRCSAKYIRCKSIHTGRAARPIPRSRMRALLLSFLIGPLARANARLTGGRSLVVLSHDDGGSSVVGEDRHHTNELVTTRCERGAEVGGPGLLGGRRRARLCLLIRTFFFLAPAGSRLEARRRCLSPFYTPAWARQPNDSSPSPTD